MQAGVDSEHLQLCSWPSADLSGRQRVGCLPRARSSARFETLRDLEAVWEPVPAYFDKPKDLLELSLFAVPCHESIAGLLEAHTDVRLIEDIIYTKTHRQRIMWPILYCSW